MGSIDKACISGFLCRLCSEMHRTVIHIYGEQGKKHGLVEKINGYLPINVSPHDPLPKTICETCLRRVEQHYELLSRLEEYRESRLIRNMSGLRPRLLRLRTQNHEAGGISILGQATFRTANAVAVNGSVGTDVRNDAASTSLSPTSTVSASGSNNDHQSVHNDDGDEDDDDEDDNNMEDDDSEHDINTQQHSPIILLSPSSSSSVQFSPLSGPSSPNNNALTGRNIFLSTSTSSAASPPYTQAPTRLCTMMVRFNDDDGDDENDEDEDDEDDDDDDDEEEDDEEEEDDDDDEDDDEDMDEEDEDDNHNDNENRSQHLENTERQESLPPENNEANTRRNEGNMTMLQNDNSQFINNSSTETETNRLLTNDYGTSCRSNDDSSDDEESL